MIDIDDIKIEEGNHDIEHLSKLVINLIEEVKRLRRAFKILNGTVNVSEIIARGENHIYNIKEANKYSEEMKEKYTQAMNNKEPLPTELNGQYQTYEQLLSDIERSISQGEVSIKHVEDELKELKSYKELYGDEI